MTEASSTDPPSAPMPRTGRAHSTFGAQGTLLELIANTADPGYDAAARRRQGQPVPRRVDALYGAVGAVAIGVVLVMAYLHTHRAAPEAARRHDALVERVRAAQNAAVTQHSEIDSLQQQIADTRSSALSGSGQTLRSLDAMRMAAGLAPAFGPGVEVTLALPAPLAEQPSDDGADPQKPENSAITDRDIRSVVNELWHDGAELVAVNAVRLTPGSAVRLAGQAILVDFQPVTSPYVVRAIGDPDLLVTNFASSGIASRYHARAGLGEIDFSFHEKKRIDLPAGVVTQPRTAAVR